jgi:hypothetical protein
MEERIKDHLVERSDDRVHRFVLMCTVCGKTWTGPELERSAMNKATARLQTAEEARKYHRMRSRCRRRNPSFRTLSTLCENILPGEELDMQAVSTTPIDRNRGAAHFCKDWG